MANYDLDEVLDVSPVNVQEETGQEITEIESKENEAPSENETGKASNNKVEEEEKNEPKSDENVESESKEEEKNDSGKPQKKKASDQFATDSAALKAAENLAIALREDVDFRKMTIEQARVWYDENRPRLGSEGFKGDRAKARALNKKIDEEDKLTNIATKLDNFIEAQNMKSDPENDIPSIPEAPEFDVERYNELLLEDPKEAAKLMKDYQKEQNNYFNELLELKGNQIIKPLKDLQGKIEEAQRIEQERMQADEQERQNKNEWDKAEDSVEKFSEAQPEGTFAHSFKECKELMAEIIKENSLKYLDIAQKDGKERAIFKLYQDALKEKESADKDNRLAQLEKDLIALKNGKTVDEINAAKGAARITQTYGGVTSKTPQKPKTAQEIFEEQMRGNSSTRSKYDLEY